MYISSARIINIRSIERFSLRFKSTEYAGWHVIIGDNGAGKSTLVRSLALALAGPTEAVALRQNWSEWLRKGESKGSVNLNIDYDKNLDKRKGKGKSVTNYFIQATINFKQSESRNVSIVEMHAPERKGVDPKNYLWGDGLGWFCASYGPYRRFSGGNKDYEKLFYTNPKLAPHLSVFGEDVALTECLNWLQTLHIKVLESKLDDQFLTNLIYFINNSGLLPHGAILEKITSDSVIFVDGNGFEITVDQLSDGYRSILSMTFELIRQLVKAYGVNNIFNQIQQGEMCIDLPGVVLIDEIDAHLHPTWQKQVGQWFVKYFPHIQFIVTTHSPLVCRACEQGTIWRLSTPGSGNESGKITGIERDRLIYGNVLDAYGTDVFGENISISETSNNMLARMSALNIKSITGSISVHEEKELQSLKSIFPTWNNK